MKITKRQLKRIIQEEIQNVMETWGEKDPLQRHTLSGEAKAGYDEVKKTYQPEGDLYKWAYKPYWEIIHKTKNERNPDGSVVGPSSRSRQTGMLQAFIDLSASRAVKDILKKLEAETPAGELNLQWGVPSLGQFRSEEQDVW